MLSHLKKNFIRPLLLLPYILVALIFLFANTVLEGIPPMGYVTMTSIATLAAVLINNRYKAKEIQIYLEKQIRMRTKDLEKSETKYRSLVNNIPGAAYRCRHDKNWTMLFISDEIERLTGYPARDFINNVKRSYKSILHPDNPQTTHLAVKKALDDGVSFQEEYRIIDREGVTRWVQDKGTAIMNDQGDIQFIDGVILDITEEKNLALEKEKLEKQYLQAQKMESVGRLAGGISHDLNNLLTPILGYADLLYSHVQTNEEAELYNNEIIRAALKARDLVQQLLTYARYQKLDYKDLELNSLVEGFGGLLKQSIRDDIDLKYSLAPGPLPIVGSRIQLEQVIMNLVVNAQDAMPDGGNILIETDFTDESVTLTISDSGEGMDRETEEHLFEPFYSTKGSRGTGLGLATVYGIIQQHQGSIQVLPRDEKGTKFQISFPRA